MNRTTTMFSRHPDPSDLPSFYDPEYGIKPERDDYDPDRMADDADGTYDLDDDYPDALPVYLPRWWVEVLCDDGEQWGAACECWSREQACSDAMQNAREHGMKPVKIICVEQQ